MNREPNNDVPPDFLDDIEDDGSEVAQGLGSDVDMQADAAPARVKQGAQVIRRFWTTLPTSPGVYRMIDAAGEVLYVGKARNLKNRVGSYARNQGHGNRIARMIAETTAMEFVTTATETEALLLEANLIKQLKPRYNVLLRDDKSLPYILVTRDGKAPQLTKHRGARHERGLLRPFASVWAVNRTINALQRAFCCAPATIPIREPHAALPPLQIKRCSGPARGDRAEIRRSPARRAPSWGQVEGVKHASRPRCSGGEDSNSSAPPAAATGSPRSPPSRACKGINTHPWKEADVFALDEQAGQFCVEVFFFRNWQNWGNRAYFPKADRSIDIAEVLAAFIVQFYADKPAPRLVLLSHTIEEPDLVADALSSRVEHRVEVSTPRRGERRQVVEGALRNAREALGRRLADTASQQKLLASVGQALGLANAPRRIEVYDNSHIMGTNAVGAMVVAGANGFMKQHYRLFNMGADELKPGDDYGMMREMLRRRFARLAKEHPRPPLPAQRGEESPDSDTLPAVAGSRPRRWRQGAAGGGAPGPRRGGHHRRAAHRHRQGARPGRRARDVLHPRPSALQAAAARSGALLHPEASRRGPPLRHRGAPGQAQEGDDEEPAGRDPRHRPHPQARPPAPFRHREGYQPRRPGGFDAHAGGERRHREGRVRPFPRGVTRASGLPPRKRHGNPAQLDVIVEPSAPGGADSGYHSMEISHEGPFRPDPRRRPAGRDGGRARGRAMGGSPGSRGRAPARGGARARAARRRESGA
jgi:excinuclease ABC subunit C